jgi:hypothetical protein
MAETYTNPRNGRTFTLVRTEAYTRKNGTQTMLKVWHAPCAKPGCQTPCEIRTPADSAKPSGAFGMIHCHAHVLAKDEVRRRGAVSQCRARARVTDADVEEIRAWAAEGLKAADLAMTYPLTEGTIREIISGRRRSHAK